jgi:hypothetical protein
MGAWDEGRGAGRSLVCGSWAMGCGTNSDEDSFVIRISAFGFPLLPTREVCFPPLQKQVMIKDLPDIARLRWMTSTRPLKLDDSPEFGLNSTIHPTLLLGVCL